MTPILAASNDAALRPLQADDNKQPEFICGLRMFGRVGDGRKFHQTAPESICLYLAILSENETLRFILI